ncbi:MAG: hypothetical protein LBL39_08620 [Planctomycetaceae bacterium]|nr:hypothetical protein [Planctomycetaceae bacterium]
MANLQKYCVVPTILFAIALFCNFAIAQNKLDSPKTDPKVQQIAGLNAKFIVALISDGGNGAWIGTEDEGVFHCNGDGKITQYTAENGLGDNNGYALAIDKFGRLWVGHLNMGVSVFNGEAWKNYDVADGIIGERIFDIEICPQDGDVWLATSAGITRYKIDADEWEHFTRDDDLLEDQVAALAFKNNGTLIVGTQCHGLAIFNRDTKGEYKHAQNIVAPERFGRNNCSPVPLVPMGTGLPSNLINDILVTKNSDVETIWIATNAGLVKANDSLTNLEYWRGKDYADKVRGLYGGAPKDFEQAPKEIMDQLLPEDYLTCLAEDEQGVIWIGTRRNGTMVADSQTDKKSYDSPKTMGYPDNLVTKILNLGEGNYLVGFYGGGVVKSIEPFKLVDRKPVKTKFNEGKIFSVVQNDFPKLPSKIKSPTIEELKAMQVKLDKLKKPLPKVHADYYGEDWKTQGDWIGRTFRDWAILCAVTAPFDHPIYFTTVYYSVHEFIGPHHPEEGDTIRRWVHWIKTDNPKTLYDPWYGYRRQAEWCDHGEAYSWSMDGPDLWYILRIREPGIYRVGMYFFNKDGHSGNNRMRDYMIEIYPAPKEWKLQEWPQYQSKDWHIYSELAESQVRKFPPLAKSRVRDFWGGVHKQFIVRGQNHYFVKIDRNYCFNTMLSSVSVDRLEGKPTSVEKYGIPILREVPYEAPPLPQAYSSGKGRQIGLFWKTLDQKYGMEKGMAVQRHLRLFAYRAAQEFGQDDTEIKALADSIKWRLNLWDEKQRMEWKNIMKYAHEIFLQRHPEQRKAIEMYEE